jgi:hypothetical protein
MFTFPLFIATLGSRFAALSCMHVGEVEMSAKQMAAASGAVMKPG